MATTSSELVVHWTVAALDIAEHVEHAPTAELSEYIPSLHNVHVVAPGFVPVFVIDMALQI